LRVFFSGAGSVTAAADPLALAEAPAAVLAEALAPVLAEALASVLAGALASLLAAALAGALAAVDGADEAPELLQAPIPIAAALNRTRSRPRDRANALLSIATSTCRQKAAYSSVLLGARNVPEPIDIVHNPA